MKLVALIALGLFLVLFLRFEWLVNAEPQTLRRAREAALSVDLCAIRAAIDNYTVDRQEPPRTLDELLTEHYLREIPLDPITRKRDWAVEFDDAVLSPRSKVYGVANVRSNSGVDSGCASSRDIWLP
ncbi:MAG TPA: hypothetical protein VKD70_12875 [Candidatus Acidoferrum sp.]|nr:hypothetical protein [Candidatus Acidoferrum sp.]